MYFANPWGLLGLLSLPIITVIHLYHRRFPPMVVAGLHLWGLETETRAAGRRRERLPVTATLLLELLAALLLTLVLSQPRFGNLLAATHLVVVLDNSASMQSTPAGDDSFRDATLEELDARINQLERGSVVTLILTGRRPVMLAGPAVPWAKAKPLLEGWNPSATRHEFQPAWDLAAQLSEESGELLFLTDHLPAKDLSIPQQMEIVSVGRPLNNTAITTARWTYDTTQNTGNLFVRVGNMGSKTVDVIVRGRVPEKAGSDENTGSERLLFNKALTIPAGASVPLQTQVPGGLGRMQIDIKAPGDGLSLDNTVTLIEPKARILTVSLTLPKESPALESVQKALAGIPDLQSGDTESAHLLIGPSSVQPPSRRDLWWFGIGPIDESEEARKKSKDLIGPYLLEKRNPLLDGVILGGVIWGGAQPVDTNVIPVISTGNTPLLGRLANTQTTGYLLNIDLTRPNLTESPDWPILVNNLLAMRRDNLPGLRRWNYRLNEEIRFRLSENAVPTTENSSEQLVLLHAGRSRPLARSSIVELPPLENTGVYEIQDGAHSFGEFAVNFFDSEESTLTGLTPGIRNPEIETESATMAIDNPYSWIIMLGTFLIMVCLLLDWFVLRPIRART